MLNFNVVPLAGDDVPAQEQGDAWKILILDAAGQAILSPILKVNELRECGVTLYLYIQETILISNLRRQLHGDRQAIADVPAIYFVEPSADNVRRIAEDLRAGLYEQVHLNFTSSVPRALLEDLAQEVALSDSSHAIAKVVDQYLGFHCLERNLFEFGFGDAFRLLNAAASTEREIEAFLDGLAASLFSVLLTAGGPCPLICASKGTAAEMLGLRLERRLRSHLTNVQAGGGLLGEAQMGDGLQRPLLLLLDRNFDLTAPLKHAAAYNALVHDVLGMRLNRVQLKGTKEAPAPKTIDVDGADWFWTENAGLAFPTVAENVDAALSRYKADMQQVTRSTGGPSHLEDLTAPSAAATLTPEELRLAISVLPELTERKRLIDSHLTLATALLEEIKARDLGGLFLAEQQLAAIQRPALVELLRGPGSPEDKLRLYLVFLLTSPGELSPADRTEYERVLKEAGCEMAVVEAGMRLRSLHRLPSFAGSPTMTPSSMGGDLFSTLGSRLTSTASATTGLFGNIMSGVKNLLQPEAGETPLTRQLDAALGLASGQQPASSSAASPLADALLLIDPRQRHQQAPSPTAPTTYSHVIVFVLGGSSYAEYNHAEDWARRRAQQRQLPLQLTFGTTKMLTGAEFLDQITRI